MKQIPKMLMPLLLCGFLWMGGSATAQTTAQYDAMIQASERLPYVIQGTCNMPPIRMSVPYINFNGQTDIKLARAAWVTANPSDNEEFAKAMEVQLGQIEPIYNNLSADCQQVVRCRKYECSELLRLGGI